MRISRVYFPDSINAGKTLALPAESAHHLANVLRKKTDDLVSVFNQQDGEYLARICKVKKGAVDVAVEEQTAIYQPAALNLVLCLGISRSDRMDFGIQKSVELGVNQIIPFYSEHGDIRIKPRDRLQKKMSHWQKVAISACEQSGRLDIPTLSEPLEFAACIDALTGTRVLFDPRGDKTIAQLQANEKLAAIIGPEGGFSESELQLSADKGCALTSLGPRIMRTETAPIAALAILQHRFGDL